MRSSRFAFLTLIPGIGAEAYPPKSGWPSGTLLPLPMQSDSISGTLWIIHCCTAPEPPRFSPGPEESLQCCESVTVSGSSPSTCSQSGARPNAHQANPYASMPSFAARPPCPCVFKEKERTSETARFHCECPLQICAVCWLPGAEATCAHPSAVENIILAKQL